MRRAAVGDFDSMFAAEYAAVLRTVFLICHDTHLAQDITQEAFVELLRHWDKVSRYERPGAWVRRVAIRKLVKAMRRDVRRREAEVTFEPPTTLEPADVDVLRAVRALPLRQRTAVVLHYYEDLRSTRSPTCSTAPRRPRASTCTGPGPSLGGLLKEVIARWTLSHGIDGALERAGKTVHPT